MGDAFYGVSAIGIYEGRQRSDSRVGYTRRGRCMLLDQVHHVLEKVRVDLIGIDFLRALLGHDRTDKVELKTSRFSCVFCRKNGAKMAPLYNVQGYLKRR